MKSNTFCAPLAYLVSPNVRTWYQISGTAVIGGYELLCGGWELNLAANTTSESPTKEQEHVFGEVALTYFIFIFNSQNIYVVDLLFSNASYLVTQVSARFIITSHFHP